MMEETGFRTVRLDLTSQLSLMAAIIYSTESGSIDESVSLAFQIYKEVRNRSEKLKREG